jgi:uncharacterized protein (TIGR02266 family)
VRTNTAEKRQPDQRAHMRAALGVQISLGSDHNFFVGLAHNVSAGGVFVATHEPHTIGSELDLELKLPEREQPIRAMGKVCWVRPYDEANDAPAGVGIRFSRLAPGDVSSIEAFIEQREPFFYE